MERYICTTCGTQYADADQPPAVCAICSDERQYVNARGQGWTTHAQLRGTHLNAVREEGPGVIGIGIEPRYAIGQRALLVRGAEGNLLWDCIPLLDPATVELVQGVGGIAAIAISHPHYYSSMVEWAHAFGCPVYLHADDRRWVMRPDPSLRFWEGERLQLGEGIAVLRLGGHFPGSSVLHLAQGEGALLTGDTLYVTPDLRHVSFMYSFPNLVPLAAREVRRIAGVLAPLRFGTLYGAWWNTTLRGGGREAVLRSADRYAAQLER